MTTRFGTLTLICALTMSVSLGDWTWCSTQVLANCAPLTSSGTAGVGRVAKFKTACDIEQSAVFESSGKVGVGAPASGGFEFQVTAPNQIGLLVEGPASGVGAGVDLKTTGTGSLQWELLDTGATSGQGAGKLNIRNINKAHDVFTIRGVDGAVGINNINPGAFQLDVITADGNGGISVKAAAATAILANNSNGDAILAENNSGASTLGVQNSTTDTTAAIADFLAPNTPRLTSSENGCKIDTNGNLTCTGQILGGTPISSANPAGPPTKRLAGRARVAAQYASLRAIVAASQWGEDFGSARLVHGVAEIALDHDFARTLRAAGAYHVFFTPKADCKGLYVARETPTSFEVRELGAGHSSLEFDYRVVGHPKSYEPVPAPAIPDQSVFLTPSEYAQQ